MKMETILSTFLQSMIGLIFLVLAFLTKRLIEDNDRQHKETTGNIELLSGEIRGVKESVNFLEIEYSDLKSKGAFERRDSDNSETLEKIKRKISSTIIGITQVQKEVGEISKKVESNDDTMGEVIWLKDEVDSQNQKLKIMYEVLAKLASQKR